MKFQIHKGKKWVSVLLLLAAALLLEATLFQLSFWKSLWQEEVTSGKLSIHGEYEKSEEDGMWHVPSGEMVFLFEGVDAEVHNLHFEGELPEGSLVTCSVELTDEGNAYAYTLPDWVIAEGVPETYDTKIYPYGKVADLKVTVRQEGELVFHPEDFRLNARMPFAFQPVRAGLVFALFLLCGLLREKNSLHRITFQEYSGKRQAFVITAVFAVFLILTGWAIVRANPFCRGLIATHQGQYQELAAALAAGKVSVDEEPDVRLLEVENPYDTIYLQANEIPYKADYAYYNGAYYVYFGIVPELLCYLPFYLLTGQGLPNYLAVFFFYAGFLVSVCFLVWQAMRRWFAQAPGYLYFFAVLLFAGCSQLVYLVVRPDMYNVPVMAANCFTAAGFGFWIRGLNDRRFRKTAYALGSFCLALNAGCRPQFLMYGLLAVPLFWQAVIRERSLFSRKGWKETAAILLPVLPVAAGVMYYNWLRFGSPVDFGANYSMTSNDMTNRGFNLERILYGIYYFLFQPPHLEGAFPYLKSAQILTDYMGKIMSESYYGGIVICNPFLWLICFLPKMRKRLAAKQMTGIAAAAAAASVIICAADANGAGILQRYSADMTFGFLLAGMLLMLLLAEWCREKGVYRYYLTWLKVGFIWNLAFAFLTAFSTDSSINLMKYNPELFYQVRQLFRI